jgi:PKD domain-containing protein
MARRLTVICAAVLALGLSGCDEEFCTGSVDDPIAAILVGLLCAGVDPPPENPPRAAFVMEPTAIDPGQTVRFDASGSTDNGRIVKYEWDLNGIPIDGPGGRYEIDNGEEPVIERSITTFTPGVQERRAIGLRVTDNGGHTHEVERTLTIRGLEPVASFTVSPNPAFVGNTVTFDASGSSHANVYEWDLDGDGTFETVPSFDPTTTRIYTTAGDRLVKLRITDLLSRSSVAQRTLRVFASRAAAVAAAKRRGFAARLTRVRLPDSLPAPKVRGGVTTLRGLAVRGRLVAPARRLGPLRPFRRARWVARLSFRATDDGSRLRGVALARFPRGRGTACLRITMATRDRGRPAGRVTVLGGRGDASRLRGGGRFRFGFRDGAPRLEGRLRASFGRTRSLPRACAGL